MDNAQATAETLIHQQAIALASLAHNGLVFATDVFDRQRYEQAKQIAARRPHTSWTSSSWAWRSWPPPEVGGSRWSAKVLTFWQIA